jgi:hypothetical protein
MAAQPLTALCTLMCNVHTRRPHCVFEVSRLPVLKVREHQVQGARTAERLPREALLQLGVTLGTAVSDAPAQATELFASIEHAREGATALAGTAARAAAGGYASTMRLQAMMGEVRMRGFTWLVGQSLVSSLTPDQPAGQAFELGF